MTRKVITKHGRDHRPPGTLGTDDPGGHDPIEWPRGLVAGQTSVDLAYRIPGSLIWLYRLGEAFTPSAATGSPPHVVAACLDTSAFDSTPRNLDYYENTAGSDWSTSNRPSPHTLDHTALGSGDDGCIKFNYNQTASAPSNAGGTWLEASITGHGAFNTGMNTCAGWFKANASIAATFGLIFGTYQGVPSGSAHGWGILYVAASDQLQVVFGGSTVATISGIIRANWYHAAITYNSSGDVFTFYLNAVAITTWTGVAGLDQASSRLAIGGGVIRVDTGGYGDFFWGEVDDVAGWSTCLTRDEIAAVYLGKGAGTQTTIEPITITAGDPTLTTGAISSSLSGGGNATQHQVMAADGAGATTWEWPTHGHYVEGA